MPPDVPMGHPLLTAILYEIDTGRYGRLASRVNQCKTQVDNALRVYRQAVLSTLAAAGTWEGTFPVRTDMVRVATMHADALHHMSDELTLAALALNHVGPDLDNIRSRIKALVDDLTSDGLNTVDQYGVVQCLVGSNNPQPPNSQTVRFDQEKQDAIQGLMRQYGQVDESCANILSQVNRARSEIYIDTSNTAVHVNTSPSPTGVDALLALYGDPNHDLETNIESSGETEGLINALRAIDFSQEGEKKTVETLLKAMSHSSNKQMAHSAGLLEHDLERLTNLKGLRAIPYGMTIAMGVAQYLKYRTEAPDAPVAVGEAGLVTALGATGGVIGGMSGTAAGVYLGQVLGLGPEDPASWVLSGIFGTVGAIAGSLNGENAGAKLVDGLNSTVFEKGSDGKRSTTIDPLTLSPVEVNDAAHTGGPSETKPSTAGQPVTAAPGDSTDGNSSPGAANRNKPRSGGSRGGPH